MSKNTHVLKFSRKYYETFQHSMHMEVHILAMHVHGVTSLFIQYKQAPILQIG